MHYNAAFSDGERLDSWGVLLYEIGDLEGAEAAWSKRLEYQPGRLRDAVDAGAAAIPTSQI